METVREALEILVERDTGSTLKDKFDFFWETRQAFGRSALLLSGGAGLGRYNLIILSVRLIPYWGYQGTF